MINREQRQLEAKERALESSYFPVEKVDVGMGKFAIIRRDTGDKLSDVSKRYTLIRNRDVFQPFVDRFGVGNIKKFYGWGKSKYYYMEINTGREFNFGTEEKPDIVLERLVIQNSYNKTRSFSFMLGAFRTVCANGLYTGNAYINYKKIHVGKIDIMKLVFQALLRYEDNSFDNWNKFKEVPLTMERQIEIVNEFETKQLTEEKLKDRFNINNKIVYTANRLLKKDESIDNQRNGWGLYNQLNQSIAVNLRGNSKTSERITANKKLEEYLIKKLGI